MNSNNDEVIAALAMHDCDKEQLLNVTADDTTLTVDLKDGRTIKVPITWYPRLAHGTPEERSNWELIGQGSGIHWEELDEDISIRGIILGRMSDESPASFARWLTKRSEKAPVTL